MWKKFKLLRGVKFDVARNCRLGFSSLIRFYLTCPTVFNCLCLLHACENVTATSSYCHVKLPIKHINGKEKKKSNPPLTLSQSKTLPKVEKSPCRSSAEHVALMLPTNTLVELGGRARDSSTTRGLPRYSLPSRCRMALRRHGCDEVKPTHA